MEIEDSTYLVNEVSESSAVPKWITKKSSYKMSKIKEKVQ